MEIVYNSDSFAVVAIEILAPEGAPSSPPRGGFEIVDKFARKDIFIEGALAERFKVGALELMSTAPSEEEIDDFIGGFTATNSQTLALH